jgi:transposase InsO family protein
VSRFECVADHRDAFGVKRLCTVLNLSRSGFYRWLKTAPARAAKKADDAALTRRIGKVHTESGKTYGAKRINAELRAGCVMVNRKRIERLMRQHGIQGRRLKRRHRTTIPDPAAQAVPDLLRRRRGSEAALLCAGPRHRARRTAIAAAHTHLITARLPAPQRTAFLHQYAWYWDGRGRRDAPPGRPLPRLAPGDPESARRAEVLQGRIADVLADRELGPVLTSYADDFWRLVREAALPRPDYLAAFHHIHLMNNRLGVVPGEEFQIARLLWLRRITGPVRTA